MRVAIIHEWLTNWAGSERCVDAMRRAFPDHHVFTSLLKEDEFPGWSSLTSTSFLQRIPPFRRSHLAALPLMPIAMRSIVVDDRYDAVIRSFHSFSTLARVSRNVPQVLYCYTPPRFVHAPSTMRNERLPVRLGMGAARAVLGRSDARRVAAHDRVIAISNHVAARMRALYGIEPHVVHPPVDVDRFAPYLGPRDDYFVFCSRLVPYKKPDVAIEAFRGRPYRLVVVGSGRMERALRRLSPTNVEFRGHVPDDELVATISRARGFVFPGEEDFGIAPVEALATGTPVIAYGSGGALDYVVHGRNGLLVDRQEPSAFARAIEVAARTTWDHSEIATTATSFAEPRFIEQLRQHVAAVL